MEKQNSKRSSRAATTGAARHAAAFNFLIPIFACCLMLSGCGSPGQPTARHAPVPQTVSDLTAAQSGNDVILRFALPTETVDGQPLQRPPTVEIFRNFEPWRGAAQSRPGPPANPALLVTIPGPLVDRYATRGRFRYSDALDRKDFTAHPDSLVVYTVRTRILARAPSAISNAATLRIFPAPDAISGLKAQGTQTAVVLTWTPPARTPVGLAPPIVAYDVYRAPAKREAAATSAVSSGPGSSSTAAPSSPAVEANENGDLKTGLKKIGESATANYRDTTAEFGKTYIYAVRSVVRYSGMTLESADSNLIVVARRDVFPPSAPQGLVVVAIPVQDGVAAHLELSWAVSPETDVAGYNVYRSEKANVPGTRVNTKLLLTPAFRDMNVAPGHRYYYAVTAVDRLGNESSRSAIVSGGVPVAAQPAP